jgi:hypothetical protein
MSQKDIDKLIDQAISIENAQERLQFIKNIPIQEAKDVAMSHFVSDYPKKFKSILELIQTQKDRQDLLNTALSSIDQDQDFRQFIQSLQDYPKFKSIAMGSFTNFLQDQEAIPYSKTIPDENLRDETMAQISSKISNKKQRLAYINQIRNIQNKSKAMFLYSSILPENNKKTLKFILSIPDEKWRSEAMAEYSKKLPLQSRLGFIMTIPTIEARENALASFANDMPFGQQRKNLIQTLTLDKFKSASMQKFADFLPLGPEKKSYLEKIPNEQIRNYKLAKYQKQYSKYQRKQYLHKQALKALESHQYTVTIDDYSFIAVAKATVDERNYVQVLSKNIYTGELNNFYVYQSNSEIGAWRYCRTVSGDTFFIFKGEDYISITFIHIELQKYLYAIYESLSIDEDFKECANINDKDSKTLNSRIQKDSVFDLLTNCSDSFHCFYNNDLLLKNVGSFVKKQKWTPRSIQKLSQISLSKRYLENIKLLIESINLYLQQFLSFDLSSFRPLYSYSFNISKQAFFECTIFKGTFTNKSNKKRYNMFINHYHYRNTFNSAFDGTYSFITFIVSTDAKITKDGLYDKVIRSGIYVYKPVEYASGMDIYGDEKQRKKNKSINHQRDIGWDNYYYYYFIGDIMNQFWPLKNLDF